jgi:protein-tyrosine phosphatase
MEAGYILFVCTGNICRSPMAAAMTLRALAGDRGPWRVASAGVAALVGQPASRRAHQVMAEIGYDVTGHRARQLTAQEALRAQWILVMDPLQRLWIERLAPVSDRLRLLARYATDQPSDLIPDPYGRSIEVYRTVRDHIRRAVDGLVRALRC